MIKGFILSFAVFISVTLSAQQIPSAQELLNNALLTAKDENKNVFVIFTATWCSPCAFLHYIISDDYNTKYFQDNYVFIELHGDEVGSKKNQNNQGTRDILRTYNGDSTGIPYAMILNTKGKKLGDYFGAPENVSEIQGFLKFIKRTSHLKDFDLHQMADRIKQLSKNSTSY